MNKLKHVSASGQRMGIGPIIAEAEVLLFLSFFLYDMPTEAPKADIVSVCLSRKGKKNTIEYKL